MIDVPVPGTLTIRNVAVLVIGVGLIVSVLATGRASAQAPTFELPAPTGKLPIGTTRWVVTDPSREELFAQGKKRDVEIVAWVSKGGCIGCNSPLPSRGDGRGSELRAPVVVDRCASVERTARSIPASRVGHENDRARVCRAGDPETTLRILERQDRIGRRNGCRIT